MRQVRWGIGLWLYKRMNMPMLFCCCCCRDWWACWRAAEATVTRWWVGRRCWVDTQMSHWWQWRTNCWLVQELWTVRNCRVHRFSYLTGDCSFLFSKSNALSYSWFSDNGILYATFWTWLMMWASNFYSSICSILLTIYCLNLIVICVKFFKAN